MAKHQRWLLHELDDARHRHGLAAAGDAEQRLRAVAPQDSFGQRFGGLGLIAGKLIWSDEFEALGGHGVSF